MASVVYFANLRCRSNKESLPAKVARLYRNAGLDEWVKENDLVGVKLHFGEKGNASFIRPILVRPVIDQLKQKGAKPFLTDTNTLYMGTRWNAVSHSECAVTNGFAYAVVDAPVIIADGLKGRAKVTVPIPGGRCLTEAHVACSIAESDGLMVMSHLKGHELTGFGGALKNIAMGCASRLGKLHMHSQVQPEVKEDRCVGCGECVRVCPSAAAVFPLKDRKAVIKDRKAVIDQEACIGCGDCIVVCRFGAIAVDWNEASSSVQEKVAEYCAGILGHGLLEKSGYMTFVMDVSPYCDCYGFNDRGIVPDVGLLASRDPVAIDQAAVDLINRQPADRQSVLESNLEPGEDKFKGLFPNIDWSIQLRRAEELGLGSREYELKEI